METAKPETFPSLMRHPTREARSDRHARGLMALAGVRAGYAEQSAARERITALLRDAASATVDGAFFSSEDQWDPILQDAACHHPDREVARQILDSVRASFSSADNPVGPSLPDNQVALMVWKGNVSAHLMKSAGMLTSPPCILAWKHSGETAAENEVTCPQQVAAAQEVDAIVDQIAACDTAEQVRILLHAYEDLLLQSGPRLPLADNIRNALNLQAALAGRGIASESSAT